jgi:uncharacterized protein
MEVFVICITALAASILTFFSGFGLGTILGPVMMIYFPIDVAIAMTGVVHFANNIFKLLLTAKKANWQIILRFGLPAIIAAWIGAWILMQMGEVAPLYSYYLWGKTNEIHTIKLIIALLLMFFALVEVLPYFGKLEFNHDKLPIGGFLSGFFGGLTGSQGALRSAFLIRAGMSKEVFVGTTVVISTMVDVTRLGVYAEGMYKNMDQIDMTTLISAIVFAIIGAILGNFWIKKVTLLFIQRTVALVLVILALGLGSGLL